MPLTLKSRSLPILNQPATPPMGAACNIGCMVSEDAPPMQVVLMLTRRCNMSCAHCSVESGPRVKGEPSLDELLQYLRDASAAGVCSFLLTGGEPMLREDVALTLLRECQRLGAGSAMTTNGFWGKNSQGARDKLAALREAGLGGLTVSYDRYHAEFQGPQPALNIARAAAEQCFSININVTRIADDPALDEIVRPFENLPSVRLRFYDVQPVGRARHLDAPLRGEVEGFCDACNRPAITEDGRMTACNGPSFFAKPGSPLHIGSLRDSSMEELLQKHGRDPILDTLRTFGPSRLRDELKQVPGFEEFPFRAAYSGICELCQHINSDPAAVAALSTRLAEPRLAAERLAKKQLVLRAKQCGGTYSLSHVNGLGVSKVWMQVARQVAQGKTSQNILWPSETENMLGRADVDWSRQITSLLQAGMAPLLLPVLNDPAMRRWAPPFFRERLRATALRDGVKLLVQQEILRRISLALNQLDGRGTLLKGAALGALAAQQNPAGAIMRSVGDIDIHVDGRVASRLREELLKTGFRACAEEDARANTYGHHHHLAPIQFQGVVVEIHTHIMSAFWGLPEAALLQAAIPLQDPALNRLDTLDAEDLLLHNALHFSTDFFQNGFKAAWDLGHILDLFPSIDWNRAGKLVRQCRAPRGFWAAMRVLCRDMELSVPDEFLSLAPDDARQRELERLAESQAWRVQSQPLDENPFSRAIVSLLFLDSTLHRAGHLGTLSARYVLQTGRANRAASPGTTGMRKGRMMQLRQAAGQWRRATKHGTRKLERSM